MTEQFQRMCVLAAAVAAAGCGDDTSMSDADAGGTSGTAGSEGTEGSGPGSSGSSQSGSTTSGDPSGSSGTTVDPSATGSTSGGGEFGDGPQLCSFASTPTQWTLPDFGEYALWPFGNQYCTGSTSELFEYSASYDLTGDGIDDLLVTNLCDDSDVGNTIWHVYPAQTSGFASTPIDWTLPDLGAPAQAVSEDSDCDGNDQELRYQLRDLAGNGQVDLLVTRSCSDPDVGRTHWLVYPNTGSGFGQTPTTWSLPPEPGVVFESTNTGECPTQENGLDFELIDMVGDSKQDLLITYMCGEDDLGYTAWRVYENTGSGYAATGTDITMPDLPGLFIRTSSPGNCNPGIEMAYDVHDFTKDGKPDLVVTSICDDDSGLGETFWQIYENTGSGFADPVEWTLPDQGDVAYPRATGTQMCSEDADDEDRFFWSTRDIDDDGQIELWIPRTCDESAGITHWRIFEMAQGGFADTSWTWGLPDLGSQGYSWDDLPGCEEAPDGIRWGFKTVTGGSTRDILVWSSCSDPAVARDYWLVYPSSCDRQ